MNAALALTICFLAFLYVMREPQPAPRIEPQPILLQPWVVTVIPAMVPPLPTRNPLRP